jgi:hypothetical protein
MDIERLIAEITEEIRSKAPDGKEFASKDNFGGGMNMAGYLDDTLLKADPGSGGRAL